MRETVVDVDTLLDVDVDTRVVRCLAKIMLRAAFFVARKRLRFKDGGHVHFRWNYAKGTVKHQGEADG